MAKLKELHFNYRTAKEHTGFDVTFHVSQDGEFYFVSTDLPAELYERGKDAFKGDGITTRRGKYRKEETNGTNYPDQVSCKTFDPLLAAVKECIEIYEKSLVTRVETKWIRYKFGLEGLHTPPQPRTPTEDDDSEMTGPLWFEDVLANEESGGRRGYHRKRNLDHELKIEFEWEILRKLAVAEGSSRLKKRSWLSSSEEVIWLRADDSTAGFDEATDRLIEWTPEREIWFARMEESMRGLMNQLLDFMRIDRKMLASLIAQNLMVLPEPQKPVITIKDASPALKRKKRG